MLMFLIQPSQTPPFVNVADAVVADIFREAAKEEDVNCIYVPNKWKRKRKRKSPKKRVALCDAIDERKA